MKKNHLWKYVITIFTVSALTLKICAQGIKVSVQVTDQDGLPVADAQLESDAKKIVNTDKEGKALAEINKYSSGCRFAVKKEGYYGSETQEYFPLSEEVKQSKLIKIKLNKIKNPIPMFVKDLVVTHFKLPKYNGEKFGYDLLIGDWLAPHGKGKIADFIFQYNGVFIDRPYGSLEKYDNTITIIFSNERDGIIEWKGLSEEGRKYGSDLSSNYQAPAKGYQSIWQQRTWKNKGGSHKTTKDIDRNFYFRVRTKLDDDGNIISAHYGKIYGDFMSFIYYLNPTPNDRNVEFDISKNLFIDERVDRP